MTRCTGKRPHMVISGFGLISMSDECGFEIRGCNWLWFAKKPKQGGIPHAPPEQMVPGATIFSPPSDIDPWASDDTAMVVLHSRCLWKVLRARAQQHHGSSGGLPKRRRCPSLRMDRGKASQGEWELAARGELKTAFHLGQRSETR